MKRLFFLLPGILCSWANPGFFNQFPNCYFVETGSYLGDGIEMARLSGFANIHSIELAPKFYEACKKKFVEDPRIHLWFGDSGEILNQVIKEIQEPITFWLDGHWSDGDTAKGSTYTPILKELEAIKQHPIKTHTILIDDVRCFGTKEFDYTELSEIINKILEINQNYVITYQHGFQASDILIAQILVKENGNE